MPSVDKSNVETVFSSLNDILALKYCFKADSNCSSYSCYGQNFSSELVDLQSILILFSKITDKSLITKEKLTKDYPTSIIFVRQTMKLRDPITFPIVFPSHCLKSLSEKNLFQNHLETVVTMILFYDNTRENTQCLLTVENYF
ncbi:hypothetical protein KSF78_0003708 [Schistosoma japonicum]|nr:hypothetical protein KSF78_0003708 [Schistosoma japonicum]